MKKIFKPLNLPLMMNNIDDDDISKMINFIKKNQDLQLQNKLLILKKNGQNG